MAQLPTPEQLRMYCDGELPNEEAAQVDAFLDAHPEQRASIAFEQTLRQRVAASMSALAPAAPAGLADRVHSAIVAAELAQTAEPTTDGATMPSAEIAGRIDGADSTATARSAEPRSASRASIYAIAAVLTLMGMVVVLSMLAPNIDQLNPSRPMLVNDDLLTDASAYAANEHTRCTVNPGARSEKFDAETPDDAIALMRTVFNGLAPRLPDLSHLNYAFTGAGICGMPGHDRSIHLLYTRQTDDGRQARMSIFIEPEDGQIAATLQKRGMEWSPCTPVPIGKNRSCSRQVYLLGADGFAYFVVCCRIGDLEEIVDQVRSQLAVQLDQ